MPSPPWRVHSRCLGAAAVGLELARVERVPEDDVQAGMCGMWHVHRTAHVGCSLQGRFWKTQGPGIHTLTPRASASLAVLAYVTYVHATATSNQTGGGACVLCVYERALKKRNLKLGLCNIMGKWHRALSAVVVVHVY